MQKKFEKKNRIKGVGIVLTLVFKKRSKCPLKTKTE